MKSRMRILLITIAIAASAGAQMAQALSTHKPAELRAKLRAGTGDPEPELRGDARRRTQVAGKGSKDEFKGRIDFPFPGNSLGITTADAAASADIRLILGRDGIDYAECFLELDEDELADEAEFKVDIRARDGRLDEKKGTIDTDLSLPGIQAGLPAVQAGDTVRAVLKDAGGDLRLVDGLFKRKK
ncbi:MAG: hypothetical protein HYX75_11865 [Acidobacteria bacterium]|nr:hypothetical protein [Acidobacteriota bacterium]